MHFQVTETVHPEDCYVVAVAGEIDLSSAGTFRQRLLHGVGLGHRVLIADLTKATFVDSSGLNALISARKRIAARKGEVTVVATSPGILQTFALSGLDRVFPISANLSDALAAAGSVLERLM